MYIKGSILVLIVGFLTFNLTAGNLKYTDTISINSGGLKFSSKDVYSSQRTSLKLFDDYRNVPKSFNLKFICNIYDPLLFGFVFRIMNDFGDYEAPLIHLLYIPSQSNSDSCAFEFHFNNSDKKISFGFDTLNLNSIAFEINASLKDKLITLKCNNIEKKVSFEFPRDLRLNFLFGLFGENTDVAPMILQNIRLKLNNQSDYFWPLNDWSGNKALEKINHLESAVKNPVWLQNKHYYWEKIYSLKTDPMAGIIFDDQQRLLFVNKDSLVVYSPQNQFVEIQKYRIVRPFDRDAIFSVFNPKTRKIITYDFHFLKVNDGRKTFSVYDNNKKTWTKVDTSRQIDQNHHHTAFWNQDTTKLITFGGYSYFNYYNSFNSHDFSTGLWEIVLFSGDTIYPRTHATIGRDPETGIYYLYGGFGNKEGLQSFEGNYFYDLYALDLTAKKITKIWNLSTPEFEFVPRGNLIFRPDAAVCYVLGNKPIEKSILRLYKISLKQPEISIVSDSIPVVFSDMAGNAFLFFNASSNELYCVTRETFNHSYANTTVYKFKFPPSEPPALVSSSSRMFKLKYLLIIALITGAGIGLYLFRFHKKRIKIFPERIAEGEKFERKHHNAIWILDDFKVFDKNGRDITYRLSKKIKQAFLILFF